MGFAEEVELVEVGDLGPGDRLLVAEVEVVEGLGLGEPTPDPEDLWDEEASDQDSRRWARQDSTCDRWRRPNQPRTRWFSGS